MASLLPRHPYGVRYFLLLLGAKLLRIPILLVAWFYQKKRLQNLRSDVSRTRIEIPSREQSRKITVDVYEKVGQSKDSKRYAHMNFHGSGFVIPSLGTDMEFCADLASTGTVVFDADYRKAPEHPFPAAFQDTQDVLSYVQNHASDFDVNHLTIGGFSAGANLAMTVAVNSPPGTIAGLVSVYGNPDMTRIYKAPNEKNYDSGVIISDRLRAFFYSCLILPGQARSDTRLSPVYAPPDRWPKHAFFACGTADSTHDAAKDEVNKLKKAGHSDATFLSVEREAHGFDKNVKQGSLTEKRTSEMYRQAIEMVERAHRD